MNLLDYILIAVLAFCLSRGIFRGLIKELSSIIGLLGGFYAAYTYYGHLTGVLSAWIENPVYLNIISFLIIWIGIYTAVTVMALILKYFMKIAFLGWLDRIGGALLGAIKGLLVAVTLIVVLTAFLPQNTVVLRDSTVARRMITVSSFVVQVTTKEMRALFSSKSKELNKTWQRKKI
jgi:membrane protein required for colicin V production